MNKMCIEIQWFLDFLDMKKNNISANYKQIGMLFCVLVVLAVQNETKLLKWMKTQVCSIRCMMWQDSTMAKLRAHFPNKKFALLLHTQIKYTKTTIKRNWSLVLSRLLAVLLVDKEKKFSRMKVWISPQIFFSADFEISTPKTLQKQRNIAAYQGNKSIQTNNGNEYAGSAKEWNPNKHQMHHSRSNIEIMFYNVVCLQLHAISEWICCVLTSNDKGAQRRRV